MEKGKVVVDEISALEWNGLLLQFSDASVYQTWAFGAACWNEKELSHLVLHDQGQIRGAVQVRVVTVPLLGSGVAYVRWGPLFRRQGAAEDPEAAQAILEALKREYVDRRKLVLQIIPNVYLGDAAEEPVRKALSELGFEQEPSIKPYRTLRLDLNPALEELRKKLDQKWRNQLNRAEKNGLELVEGTSDELYGRFVALYQGMMARKQFETTVSVEEFRELQRQLPPESRMTILLAHKEGKDLGCLIGSAFGDTGIYLLGASSEEGMQSKASYLLQWTMIQKFKALGCHWYDLGGVNPETNPGVYHFKSGITQNEAVQLGRFQCAGGSLSNLCVGVGNYLREIKKSHPVKKV